MRLFQKSLKFTSENLRPNYLKQAHFLFEFHDVIFCLYSPFLLPRKRHR